MIKERLILGGIADEQKGIEVFEAIELAKEFGDFRGLGELLISFGVVSGPDI